MKKPAIPSVPLDAANKDILASLKEAVEIITGQRGEKLKTLSYRAGLGEAIAKINTIIKTLQNNTDALELVEFINGVPMAAPGVSVTPSGTFTHAQDTASATWTANHNLGYKPSVTTLTFGGVFMFSEFVHVSNNQVLIYFDTPTTGQAVFS